MCYLTAAAERLGENKLEKRISQTTQHYPRHVYSNLTRRPQQPVMRVPFLACFFRYLPRKLLGAHS